MENIYFRKHSWEKAKTDLSASVDCIKMLYEIDQAMIGKIISENDKNKLIVLSAIISDFTKNADVFREL